MVSLYKCDYCGKIFQGVDAFYDCQEHEEMHKKDKYADLKMNCDTDICDKCEHVYYVYNVEKNCKYAGQCDRNNCWCKFMIKENKNYE